VRLEDCFSPGGIAIRRRPSAVGVVVVFVPATGSLDHAVQRHMFDDFEFSNSESLLIEGLTIWLHGALDAELSQMMVNVFVHENGPLLRL
jgi:hypothetical protein